MIDGLLIAVLIAIVGALGWIFVWIAGHHKDCHKAPGEALASLAQRMTGTEEEAERLAQNAHDDRDVIGAAVLDVALIMKHLNMNQTPQRDIPAKLRALAANLERPQP